MANENVSSLKIKSLYKDYFQKSKVFLYPALGIKKAVSVTPIKTYVSWESKYAPGDMRLICLYHLRNDLDYKVFEKNKLFGNPLFENFWEIEAETPQAVYVFNFEQYKADWQFFLKGKYSQFSPELKKKISEYCDKATANYTYVESYLYPERFYEIYSQMLLVSIESLKIAGELCDKPDLPKEILTAKLKNLEMNNILT